jgi:hypothetical protein
MPDVVFTLTTSVEAQDIDLPPDNEILLFRIRIWKGKEVYLSYNVINEKETAKIISPQFNILETELTCQILKIKITYKDFWGLG